MIPLPNVTPRMTATTGFTQTYEVATAGLVLCNR